MLFRLTRIETPSQRASATDGHAADTLGSSPAVRLSVVRSRKAANTPAPNSTAPMLMAMTCLRMVIFPRCFGSYRAVAPGSPLVTRGHRCRRGRVVRPRRRVLEAAAQDRIPGTGGDDDGDDRADRVHAGRPPVRGPVVPGPAT